MRAKDDRMKMLDEVYAVEASVAHGVYYGRTWSDYLRLLEGHLARMLELQCVTRT